MRSKTTTFLILILFLFGAEKTYASSEGVHIFNEDNVVFHSEDYVIHNAIDEDSKPINTTLNSIEKATKQYSISKEKRYKKLILKEKVSNYNSNTALTKTISEKRNKVKECSFVPKVSNNNLSIFNNIPFEKKIPDTYFVVIKEVVIGCEKIVFKFFKLFGNAYLPTFLITFYILISTKLLFFYLYFSKNAKNVAYLLKRGPPFFYINIKY